MKKRSTTPGPLSAIELPLSEAFAHAQKLAELRVRRHNGGPALDSSPPSLAEAQRNPDVMLRPSYLMRYAGAGAPKRAIAASSVNGAFGTWVLLRCGHWREIRDWAIMPAMGRKRPAQAACGCCRVGIAPDPADVAKVADFLSA